MERIPSAQPPPCPTKHPSLEIADIQGLDFPMYMYKPRRGTKRGDDSKETYKLPHRLIEKKRRDRINECISQLKDLLPEHLKLTTLGHLEKAVVLELTLKHVKALGTLLEQQQQKIIALQSGMQISDQSSVSSESSEEMFRFGFHKCAKEVLQYLAAQESSRELMPSHMISHIHKVASEVLDRPAGPQAEEPVPKAPEKPEKPVWQPAKACEGQARNCVPVIQRTYAQEQSGSDTDTDSGYGGEHEKQDPKAQHHHHHPHPHHTPAGAHYGKQAELRQYTLADRMAGVIKQECDEPRAKRPRSAFSEDESACGAPAAGGHGGYVSFPSHQSQLCMPFYLLPPSAAAAAAYLPILEKCWYPGGMSVMYPGMSGPAAGVSPEKLPPSRALPSPRAASPASHHPQTLMDSPALLQALKQVPPLNLETKE